MTSRTSPDAARHCVRARPTCVASCARPRWPTGRRVTVVGVAGGPDHLPLCRWNHTGTGDRAGRGGRRLGTPRRRPGRDHGRRLADASPARARTLAVWLPGMPVKGRARWWPSGCRTTNVGVTSDFAPTFRIARGPGWPWPRTPVNFSGPAAVERPCRRSRRTGLGHGCAAWKIRVLERVVADGVALEVCPGSNVALGVHDSDDECRCWSCSRRRHGGAGR